MKYLFIYLFRRKKLIKINVEKVGDNVFFKNLFMQFFWWNYLNFIFILVLNKFRRMFNFIECI